MAADPTPADIEAALAIIRESLHIGLQDAELDGEPGRQRIGEWVDFIAEQVRAALPDHDARIRAEIADRIAAEATGWRIGPCDCGEVDVRELIHDLAAIARTHATPPEEPDHA
jgi:hypothetical protein